MIPYQPALNDPSIETLATAIVWLEHAEPCGARGTVALGESFARLLPPDIIALFQLLPSTEPIRIYQLRNVLLDAWIMVLFDQRAPIRETVYLAFQEECDLARTRALELQPTNPACHYIIGSTRARNHYYHWMAQSLPAIDRGLRRCQHPSPTLALPPLLPWQEETLALLGHAAVPRLELGVREHYEFVSAEFAEYLSARLPGIVSRTAAETYARLRSAVPPAADGADAIYVARTDAATRPMANEAALIAMLQRHNVQVVTPGALPVSRQLALFRRARLVIGPHGAGLSNIIGCEAGTHVYELLPSDYPNYCYNRLAQSCGLRYRADVFASDAGNDSRWSVDLDMVARRLEMIRS